MDSPIVHPLRGLSSFSCTITNTEERHLLLPSVYVQQTFEALPSKVVVVTPDEKVTDIEVKELDGLPYLTEGWPALMAEYALKEQEMVLFTYSSKSPLYLSFFDVKRVMKHAAEVGGRVPEHASHENDRLVGQLKTPTAASVWEKAASPNSPDVFIRTDPIHKRSVNSKPRKGWCSSSRAEQVAPRLLNFGEVDLTKPKIDMRYSRLPLPWKKKSSEDMAMPPMIGTNDHSSHPQTESKSSNLVASQDATKLGSSNPEVEGENAGGSRKKVRAGSGNSEDDKITLSPGWKQVKYDAPAAGTNIVYPIGTALPIYDLPRNNCWITVPKESDYKFEQLPISPWFALQNLTAGENKMMLTMDGQRSWEVVCEADFDYAVMTKGWKEFAADNQIAGGQSFVLSQYLSIPNGWILNRITCA